MNIKLYYYSKGSNFGDVINPYILEKIFNKQHTLVSEADANLYMIGSILGKTLVRKGKIFKRFQYSCKDTLSIWSSGFIRENLEGLCLPRRLNVCALRGKLSEQLLSKISGKRIEAVLGDGGLLISRLFDCLPEKKYPLGIVPHFIDENLPEVQALHKKNPGSVIISPIGDPLECAKRIAECETIISSSLHGLIAADSFGIPNYQIQFSNNIVGGLFKYNDYYSVFGLTARPLQFLEVYNNEFSADAVKKLYKISFAQVCDLQEQLISCFPFK